MGDLDLVSALALGRIRSVSVGDHGSRVTYSRFVTRVIHRSPDDEPQSVVRRLLKYAATEADKPVLYYESDEDLLLVSRHRSALSAGYRFVVPDPDLVEDLVDKDRFHRLADQLDLNVPRARVLTARDEVPTCDLTFPVVVKPTVRDNLSVLGFEGKAHLVASATELNDRWHELRALDVPLVTQEYIEGPEASIESYHAYVDADGQPAGEFTGRKIRTRPPTFGYSTALATSSSPDVLAAGRRLVELLDFRGVLKADFKRDPDGRLHLLEVNPRFNLWHHLGATAGVNLPALVHADLTGTPRPASRAPTPGLTWCQIGDDRRAAAEQGVPFLEWAPWLLHTAARANGRWSDPMPMLRGRLVRRLRSAARNSETGR